jgi:hypothetical protein
MKAFHELLSAPSIQQREVRVPLGRLSEFRGKEDADLYTVTPGRGTFDDDTLTRHRDRAALKAWLQKDENKGGASYALKMDEVPFNCVAWRKYQTDRAARVAAGM